MGWGDNEFGESTVPPGSDYIAIAAGRYHNYALRSNGSIVGWGDGSYNCLIDIPAGTDFTAISAGDAWGAALMSDGTIVQWGDYNFGLYPPPAGTGYSDLGGFYKQGLALSDDGRIVGWGQRTTAGLYPPPTGTGHTGLAQGEYHGLAVKGDGSVAMWGDDNSSQLHIPEGTYNAVAAGRDFSLALRTNGSIAQSGAVMGENNTAPAGDQYTAIAAGEFHGLAIGNIALTADFTGNKTVGVKPLVVQFTDTTTGGTPTSWLWDFGDGDTTDATLRNPLHTYSASGDYTVTLTVTNTMGCDTVIKPDYITVLDITAPPVADFTADITTGTVPMEVDFTDTSLNYPSSWSWDFGDGGTSTEQNPTHTYTTAGSFDVTLTATNSIGSDSETKTGYITGITKPQADFTSNTTSGMRPLAVQFNDTSLYSPTIWTWDFGDGTSSGDKDPIHTYNTAGVYTVALRAANGAGSNWSNKTGYITVNSVGGSDDVGIFRPSTHMFYLRPSDWPTTPVTTINWGLSTDLPVTGDWNGDGTMEVGVYRPSTHTFYLRPANWPTTPVTTINWGLSTDLPVTGDWNGDGTTEVGVYRPSTHTFLLRPADWPTTPVTTINWGLSTDLPVTGNW